MLVVQKNEETDMFHVVDDTTGEVVSKEEYRTRREAIKEMARLENEPGKAPETPAPEEDEGDHEYR